MSEPSTLHVHDLSGAAPDPGVPLVLAVHGITANGLSWTALADQVQRRRGLGAIRFLAPDLRGRGSSPVAGEPGGLAGHVADLVELLRATGAPRTVVVGASMGAFVGALLAAGHPEALDGLVLVDGGLALALPPDQDVDTILAGLLGPVLDRLSMTFASPEEYLAFFDPHPALGPLLRGPHRDQVLDYLRHDCRPSASAPGRWASSCDLAAIRRDGADTVVDAELPRAVHTAATAGVPIEFLWAERGLLNQPVGLYNPQLLAALDVPGSVRQTFVPDSNHYSIMFDDAGVTATADAIDRLLP